MSIMKNTGLHTSRIEVGTLTLLDELICEHADHQFHHVVSLCKMLIIFQYCAKQQIKYLSCIYYPFHFPAALVLPPSPSCAYKIIFLSPTPEIS